ncbi:MAG: hypothetical protein DIU68_009705 [Chloroflexota bacterium]|nr:MAG: hypothetical protein DIU68_19160 [Chloroflexota bacterium]
MADYAPTASVQDEVLTFLLSSPTLQEIIAFHASDAAQERLRYLLDANREGTLSSEERAELEEASQINHFMILLKTKAHQALRDK